MKKIVLSLIICLGFAFTDAQDNEVVNKLVADGIELHDKGDYTGAIKKYDEALAIQKTHYTANYEKSFSLFMAKRYDESIGVSKFIIEQLPETPNKVAVYANYGSALDDKGEPEKALDIYNEGIKNYPSHYLLYFNKGLTLARLNRPDEALLCYQKTLELKPLHVSSGFLTGSILQYSNKLPALLSTLLFLALEPQSKRSEVALERVEQIMYGNIKKNGDKGTTITINSDLLDKKNKKKENDFSSVEMMMSLLFVSANDKQLEKIDDAEKLGLQLQLLVSMLSEQRKDGKGFYWKFYVPFFIALKEKNYTSTFAHIVFAGKKDEAINKWLADNNDKVDEFYFWLKNYKWTI